MPTPRRRPWGQLWAAAPWDGKARPPEPLRIPATEAALIDTPPPLGTLSLRRRAWGRLFAAAPWGGKRFTPADLAPPKAAPPPQPTPSELFAALPVLADEPPTTAPPPPDSDRVGFDFPAGGSAEDTLRMTPPTPEVLS